MLWHFMLQYHVLCCYTTVDYVSMLKYDTLFHEMIQIMWCSNTIRYVTVWHLMICNNRVHYDMLYFNTVFNIMIQKVKIRCFLWFDSYSPFLTLLFSSLSQKTVNLYPFQIHSIFLSSFASLIGPFGGFFASGFKRAFKIKVRNVSVSLCFTVVSVLGSFSFFSYTAVWFPW